MKKIIKKGSKFYINQETRNLKRYRARCLNKDDVRFLSVTIRDKFNDWMSLPASKMIKNNPYKDSNK